MTDKQHTHAWVHEVAGIQRVAMAAERGDVDPHGACNEIAQRLGQLHLMVLDALVEAHVRGAENAYDKARKIVEEEFAREARGADGPAA